MPIASATVTPAPAVHPLAQMAVELEQLSSRQLQAITGCRRRVAKQQLVALALAW
jgi:hypothetical protein